MANTEHNLSLVVKAVDKASGPLRSLNLKLGQIIGPAKVGLKDVGKSLNRVGAATVSLGGKLAGLGIAGGLGVFSIVKSAVEAGDKLGEMAQRVGLGVDAYAQLQFAAAQADVEQEQFNSSMDQFNKNLGQAKAGTGRMLAFLEKVGPNFAKQVAGAKDNETALKLMARAFEKVKDPAKRAALATAAFGDPQMGQFLGQGAEEIQKMREEFFRLNGSQEKFVQRSGSLDNSMRTLGVAFTGLRNNLATALMPAFERLTIKLGDFISKHRDEIVRWAENTGTAILTWASNGGMDKLIMGFKDIGKTIIDTIDKIGGLKGASIGLAGVMSLDLGTAILGLLVNLAKLNFLCTKVKGGLIGLAFAPVIKGIGDFSIALRAGYPALEAFNLAFGVTAGTAGAAALAIGGVAAAIYQVVKHWDELKEASFGDVGAWFRDGVGSLIGMDQETDEQAMRRMNKSTVAIPRNALGPPITVPPPAPMSMAPSQPGAPGAAHVTVDFANMPKWARANVTREGNASVDMSVGYSLVTQ